MRFTKVRITIKNLREVVNNINSQRKENIKWTNTLDSIIFWFDNKEVEFKGSDKNKQAWEFLMNTF